MESLIYNTDQNDNGLHAPVPEWGKVIFQTKEVGIIYGEILLFIHMVYICILHIL